MKKIINSKSTYIVGFSQNLNLAQLLDTTVFNATEHIIDI